MTGGAGFIGGALCARLAANNEILVYDSLRRDSLTGRGLIDSRGIRLVEGDVLDLALVSRTVKSFRPNIVIHLAAIAGIDTVMKSPTNTMKTNILGTCNVLDAVMQLHEDVERFVDFSTSEVFGTQAYKLRESHNTSLAPVGEARWTYSVSKLAGEHLVHAHHREYGLPTVIIRPFNVYGPGQVGEGAIHVFVMRCLLGEDLQIHGDGDQIRSWCYIDDLVEGVILSISKQEAVGELFNIGSPQDTVTINDLAERVVRISGSPSRIRQVPKTYVDVELRIANIDKAKEILGYSPCVGLDEGLAKTIDWYRGRVSSD